MAYNKPFFATQDFAVGIQSINRLIDNNQALYDLWTENHGSRDDGSPDLRLLDFATRFGRHNDILIARSVSHLTVQTYADGTKYLQDETRSRIINSVQRIGTGQWRLWLNHYDIFAAVAVPYATSVVDRKVTCRTSASSGAPPLGSPGYTDVSTWNVATLARADFDFSIAYWAKVQPWTL